MCFSFVEVHSTLSYSAKLHRLAAKSEKAMAAHSSTLAWKIPWTEEPGRLHAVHGVARSQTQLSDFTFTFHFHALEKETAMFLPRESQGWESMVGCHHWGRTELDMTEVT